MLKEFEGIRIRPVSWLKALVYACVILAVYRSALVTMAYYGWASEDYSYGYLIPLVVLYLVWEKREVLSEVKSVPSWYGLIPLALGIALYWLGELGGEFYTLYCSFWLVVVAAFWVHLGWRKIKSIWFALIMMLTMFPFPNYVNVRLTFQLKLLSSRLGVWMLHVYGMSAYREGNVIDLGFTQLQVVDACSGLRYVMPLMILSLLLAYWFRDHWWKRILLVLSSVPLAIFVNGFRIAVTGVLYSMVGAKAAEGFFHGFSGWLIFLFCIPFLLVEMWVLSKLPPKQQRGEKTGMDHGRDSGEPNPKSKIQRSTLPFFQPVSIVAIVLLATTLVLSKTVEFREKIPIKMPLASFPMKIGEWTGDREQMEQQFIDALHFSDYALVDYENGSKKAVNFYTAYYESQRKGETTHSPETCLPGSGWEFKEAGAAYVPIGQGKSMRINRAFIEKGGARDLTYYWFAQRGRVLTNLYQVKLYSFWDALTKQRTDGALVRLITPVYNDEKLQDAEKRLQDFAKDIVPVLKEYIPE
jgi:exosortase D (VPLPA-CTERM-specific)